MTPRFTRKTIRGKKLRSTTKMGNSCGHKAATKITDAKVDDL